jgi:hypothetical protein
MAKKQTRRSISVSRTTYERLKAFCEANNISMSQLVETRVNDFLGEGGAPAPAPTTSILPSTPRPAPAPRPSGFGSSVPPKSTMPSTSTSTSMSSSSSSFGSPAPTAPAQVVPMTSAAARFAVDPPPPIIKPKQQDTNAPKPAEKRPDQIFTF